MLEIKRKAISEINLCHTFMQGGFSLWHSFKVAPVVVALFQSGTWKYYLERELQSGTLRTGTIDR